MSAQARPIVASTAARVTGEGSRWPGSGLVGRRRPDKAVRESFAATSIFLSCDHGRRHRDGEILTWREAFDSWMTVGVLFPTVSGVGGHGDNGAADSAQAVVAH
jgi:hypothetical protein